MSTNSCEVYLAFKGDNLVHDEITKELGVSPTDTKLKGTHIPNKIPRTSMWIYSSGKIVHDYIDVEELVVEILRPFRGSSGVIQQQIKKYNLSLVLEVILFIAMNDEVPTPSLCFSNETLSTLDELGASIDVDLYRS